MTDAAPPKRALGVVLPALPAALAPAAVALARAAPGPVLLPILATLAVHPVMAILLRRGRRGRAALAALLWAASLSASVIVFTARDPAGMERTVLRGTAYRDEMFAFIRTGSGRESDPARFLPEQFLHLAAFAILTLGSGGLLGLALGAVLVGYMSFYVGSLAAAGGAPAVAFGFGWPPWAILRVVAFVLLGVGLSEPFLLRLPGTPAGGGRASRRPWYLAAGALLVADASLKLLFAPSWAALLRPCLGP